MTQKKTAKPQIKNRMKLGLRQKIFLPLFQMLKQVQRDALTVFMPQYCVLCDSLTNSHLRICQECKNQLPAFQFKTIQRPFNIQKNYQQLYSGWDYLPVMQTILEKVKFKGQKKLLQELLSDLTFIFPEKYDLVAYVPLSFSRYIERGFNQSKLIAQKIAQELDLPCLGLLRRKHAEKQSSKNREARLEMLAQSPFELKKNINLKEKKVLLVDDIVTTGATLASIAHLMKEKQAQVTAFALMHVN